MPGQSAKRVFALDVPGIHGFMQHIEKDVDGRVKPGHDDFFGAAWGWPSTCLSAKTRPIEQKTRKRLEGQTLMNILPGNMRFGAGQPVRRLEDQRLLTGKGQFIDDRPEDGARASANPESRDSPMCNCTSGVRCFALRCANWRIGE